MIFSSNKEKIIFYKFPIFLFSLIPFFLITGPFLSDLAISIISLIFILYCFKNKNFSYFKNKYFYFFLVFWIYLILNSLFNNFNLDSFRISLFFFRYGVFVVAIVHLLDADHKFIKNFFYCILFCFVALILDGFYQYFVGENIFGWKSSERISSFFGEEEILGSYIARLWPIFFGLSIILYKKKNNFFYFFILIFILSEALIFLSGDRSAFFYINLSAIFVILFSKKLLKLRLLTLSSSVILLVIISFINPSAKERVFDHTMNQMNLSKGQINLLSDQNESEELYIFSKQHTHHYITAYKMFLDNKIFGVGVKKFRKLCSDERYIESELSCSSHPHNSYIQILSETGIIGFLFLIITLIYFLGYLFKHSILRTRGKYFFSDFEVCILSGIAIYLWPFIPTGNVFNNWLTIATILNFPFLIWSIKLKKT